MVRPVVEYIHEDLECEGPLERLHGPKELDRACYQILVSAEAPLTTDAVAETVDRERSTVYRSVQRTLQAGLVERAQVNYDQSGYFYLYEPLAAAAVVDERRRLVVDWFAKIGRLIAEFEERCGNQPRLTAKD